MDSPQLQCSPLDLLPPREDLPVPTEVDVCRRDIAEGLVVAFVVVVLDELAHQIPKMFLPQHDEVVQALLLDRLHEPLRVGVLIRCPDGRPFELDVILLQEFLELGRELRVLVTDEVLRLVTASRPTPCTGFGLVGPSTGRPGWR